jgi:hypothetical protein
MREDGRMARAALVALCLALAALAVTALSDDGPEPTAAAAPPEGAPVRDCRDRITGAFTEVNGVRRAYRFAFQPRHDTIFGPLALSGAAGYGRPGEWDALIRNDTWPKTVALVRRGARVTLEVPADQRSWMHLEYGGDDAITLAACRRRLTPFGGGFTIDYARAPRQGRCAELIVWVDGSDVPWRERLFAPGTRACA